MLPSLQKYALKAGTFLVLQNDELLAFYTYALCYAPWYKSVIQLGFGLYGIHNLVPVALGSVYPVETSTSLYNLYINIFTELVLCGWVCFFTLTPTKTKVRDQQCFDRPLPIQICVAVCLPWFYYLCCIYSCVAVLPLLHWWGPLYYSGSIFDL